jgi:hypothetical protein
MYTYIITNNKWDHRGYVKNKSTTPGSSANARNASTSSWLYVPKCWPFDDCLPDKYTTDKPNNIHSKRKLQENKYQFVVLENPP